MKQKIIALIKKYSQLILLVGIVFLSRITYVDMYDIAAPQVDITIGTCLTLYISNATALIISLILIIWLSHYNSRITPYGEHSIRHILTLLLLVVSDSLLVSLLIYYVPPTAAKVALTKLPAIKHILYYTIGIMPINLMLCVMVDLVIYFTRHQQQMLQIEQQKSKSQYQYQQLKQQLNPHFLFNSLNILDYLVLNGEQERASSFIRKLASIYRYLLNTSEAKTLTLQEELEFVNTYTDLLKERFVEGFEISIAVDDALLQKQIIPCALQLLVENAIKHNIANKQHPLHVKIQSKDNKIIVSNNYQPRLSTKPSTGIGLKSIEKQYKDISGLSIQVINNKQEFIVTLPLL